MEGERGPSKLGWEPSRGSLSLVEGCGGTGLLEQREGGGGAPACDAWTPAFRQVRLGGCVASAAHGKLTPHFPAQLPGCAPGTFSFGWSFVHQPWVLPGIGVLIINYPDQNQNDLRNRGTNSLLRNMFPIKDKLQYPGLLDGQAIRTVPLLKGSGISGGKEGRCTWPKDLDPRSHPEGQGPFPVSP